MTTQPGRHAALADRARLRPRLRDHGSRTARTGSTPVGALGWSGAYSSTYQRRSRVERLVIVLHGADRCRTPPISGASSRRSSIRRWNRSLETDDAVWCDTRCHWLASRPAQSRLTAVLALRAGSRRDRRLRGRPPDHRRRASADRERRDRRAGRPYHRRRASRAPSRCRPAPRTSI